MVKLIVYSLCCAASWPRSVVMLETCFQNHWIPAIYERVSLTDFVPVDAALFGLPTANQASVAVVTASGVPCFN